MPEEKVLTLTSNEVGEIASMLRDLYFLSKWYPKECTSNAAAALALSERMKDFIGHEMFMTTYTSGTPYGYHVTRFQVQLDAVLDLRAPDACSFTQDHGVKLCWHLADNAPDYMELSPMLVILEGDARRAGGEASLEYDIAEKTQVLELEMPMTCFAHGQLERLPGNESGPRGDNA